jgi:hypothetical protein
MKTMFLSYQSVFCMGIALGSLACDSPALGQTNNPPAPPPTSTNVTKLDTVTVVGHLNDARSEIVPNLGATAFTISESQIAAEPQGANAPFSQLILRAPGVAEDSAENGDLHVRGEHANLQYRINDVLLPEGIAGFGLELDPRFVKSMQLITGSLPAQYGFGGRCGYSNQKRPRRAGRRSGHLWRQLRHLPAQFRVRRRGGEVQLFH